MSTASCAPSGPITSSSSCAGAEVTFRAGIMYASPDSQDAPLLNSNMFSLSGAKFFGAINRSINLGGQSALALRLLLALFSSKISSGANRPFGDEFRAARKASEKIGAQLVLGDRPIEITLERAWNSLKWSDKLRLIRTIFQGIASPSVGKPDSNLKDEDMPGSPFQLYEQLSLSYPTLLQPLIHERDTARITVDFGTLKGLNNKPEYLSWSLKRSKAVNGSKTVVGVIGKGHMNGVVYALVSDLGDLRFRDLAGGKSGDCSNGWINSVARNLVRDTVIGFVLWALYEQLKTVL